MRVLVACEFSGRVRDAFLARGHEAVSCDLLPSESPGPHIQGDIRTVPLDSWDLLIAHPDCRYLANSGVSWLHRPGSDERWELMHQAAAFFKWFLDAPVEKVCVENPVMHGYGVTRVGRRQDQTIQPYQFGEPESKRTCLWLKGLPLLEPTNTLPLPASGKWENQTPSGQNKIGPSPDRWKARSRTYVGIAEAMASQWG